MKKFIDISYDDESYSNLLNESKLKKWIKRIFDELKLKESSCSIVFTSNENIHKLNKKYFNKDYPTNVLSFSQVEGENIDFINSGFLGDIIISIDYVNNFINDKTHSFEDEINFLILHGILHLLGYNHVNDNGIMDKKEEDIYYKLTGIILE